MCYISSYIGWGFPLASHSMTIVSLGSTICSFIDCFMMVGGCLTADREMNQLSVLDDKMIHIIIKTCILTHLPEECPEPKHSATKAAAVVIWPVSPSLWCMESSKTFPHQFSCSEIQWRTTEDMHMWRTCAFMLCGPEQNTFRSNC